ncbi:MAG: thioredoxin domain-containing protein [Solirubrobacterales bacterium]|nr:thioredoxin domain-containing protein [Solirubrobacterales bacterium]
MSELGSAALPPVGPEDHLRGDAQDPVLIEYGDFECPYCAKLSAMLTGLKIQLVFRHFPVRSSHPRAWAAACAAEAAALQGHFWEMHDSLFSEQGRLEDPHLWRRARELELELERFEQDRRSAEVAARVRLDFESGIRAGVATTPTVFVAGEKLSGAAAEEALGRRLVG